MNPPEPMLPDASPRQTLAEVKYICDLMKFQKSNEAWIAEIFVKLQSEIQEIKGQQISADDSAESIFSSFNTSAEEIKNREFLLVRIEDGLETIISIKHGLSIEASAEESALAAVKNYFGKAEA
jgi:hypothetical protein